MTNQSVKHFFRSISIVVLLLGMVIFGVSQQAGASYAPLIQFTIGNSGSVTSDVNKGPLTGNVAVGSVTGTGTPSNRGLSLGITNGVLTFTTGNPIGVVGNTWTFAPGTLILTGSILDLGLTNATLMNGTFNSDVTVVRAVDSPYYNLNIASGAFSGSEDTTLTSHYGLTSPQYLGALALFFSATVGSDKSLMSTAISGGTVSNAFVPVPPSLLLLGSGLAGFIVFRRKISKK